MFKIEKSLKNEKFSSSFIIKNDVGRQTSSLDIFVKHHTSYGKISDDFKKNVNKLKELSEKLRHRLTHFKIKRKRKKEKISFSFIILINLKTISINRKINIFRLYALKTF